MSVYRGQEPHSRHEKKTSESSASRKQKKEISADSRPIITQEKHAKGEKDKSSRRKVVIAEDVKKEKKTERGSKRHNPEETRRRNETSLDPAYLKSLLEKKLLRKSEGEKKAKEEKRKEYQTEDGIRKEKSKKRVDGTRTRTLSPTEVKQLVRPKLEIGGGDTAETVCKTEAQENQEEYEDDFEDYESDFEEEPPESVSIPDLPEEKITVKENEEKTIATESEEKMTVGETKVVEEQWKKDARRKEIEAIKDSIEKENNMMAQRKVSITPSSEDNPLEKAKSSNSRKIVSGINVVSSKKQKMKDSRRRRGEELLSMISLDAISYNILEIPPIPYDDFMKAFGRSNTKQAYVQTNEDNLDEETQTDEIRMVNKWTQNPPEYLGSKQRVSYVLTNEERLGVGGDAPTEEEFAILPGRNTLWKFLSWASQMVLTVLERKSGNFLSLEDMPNHSKAMVFGDGFLNLNVGDIPFLKGKSVTHLCVLHNSLGRLLSVHVNKEKSFQKTMMCLWSLQELSKPLRVLMASNRITSCCFGPNQGNLVFAGLSDGSVCLWDLREPSAFHSRVTGNEEWSLQSPTYTTAGNLGQDGGHCSPVVAVRVLSNVDRFSDFGDFTPVQICSLDKDGNITLWTVVQLEKAPKNGPLEDLGLAHWGRVKLVKSSSFCIFASLRDEMPGLYITCNDILVNEAEGDGFYVANSLGSVHHCSSYGYALKPKFYVPSKQDAIVEATCLEMCPFNANYFLVGCGDGSIRLHSRFQEQPLICWNSTAAGDDRETAVVSLSWIKTRPCMFFALDSMSRINIWDLRMSDMYPDISLLLTERRIVSMKLIPVTEPRQVPFIVIGTEGGNLEIHRLKKEFGCRSESDVQSEMKMFLKYVSIL